ncbi:MAG: PDZ domain-containing protein [Acidobacteria bacterium]|nr:PDZ domain-containing protein [Acidobacteriota bacterium]
MRVALLAAGVLACCGLARAQLTMEQKVDDFQHLAALFAKNYGPYEWKRETQRFDLLDIGPWLAQVRATSNDLDFYDVMSLYVSKLNDAHDYYQIPSSYAADLHFGVDIFDGKALIEFVDRGRLPQNEFPFEVGDELISIDGKPVSEVIDQLSRYNIAANTRSTRRLAASLVTFRPQGLIPRAVDLPPFATVVVKRRIGATGTYFVPWARTGLPLNNVGPVPSPRASKVERRAEAEEDYMAPLRALMNCALPEAKTRAVRGFGAITPVYALPAGFIQRLGRAPGEFFFSGTFQWGGMRIGFIRIPHFAPVDPNTALLQFEREIAFMQTATDGLVIDDMRNPGGSVGYTNALLSYIMPDGFRAMGFEVRATSNWVVSISSALESAKAQRAPQYVIDLLGAIKDAIVQANSENRGRTGPIPLDDVTLDRPPAKDLAGRVIAYTKPIIVLVDELSASAGDMFPATVQDNGRGLLFGMRTMGAGGNVDAYTAGTYSEGFITLTESLMVRGTTVIADEFPDTSYVENVGVRPDMIQDYMTKDNLMRNGAVFVEAFSNAIVNHIRARQSDAEGNHEDR